MMFCNEVQDKLYEHIYDELNDEEKSKIKAHLADCIDCSQKHLELKKLLINDMEGISKFAEEIKAPENLSRQVKRNLNVSSNLKVSRYVSAACILIFMFYAVPVAAYYAVENTVLNKYIDFSKELTKDIDEGKLQVINKSDTMKDITFRVDGIIRNADVTTILFTIKVPEGMNINYAMPDGTSDVVTLKDQFGTKYRSMGSAMNLKSANEDGEVTAVMDFEPLKFWSYKLTINITALNTGTMKVTKASEGDPRADKKGLVYDLQEHKSVYGNWELDFYIDRSFKK